MKPGKHLAGLRQRLARYVFQDFGDLRGRNLVDGLIASIEALEGDRGI